MDTIFALATAHGKSGVAVIRISGKKAFFAAEKLIHNLPESRKTGLRKVYTLDGELLDEALILKFDEKQSFTGEDVVELQLHGSISIVSSVLSELSKIENCRLAEPGEFTRRSLENGRMDLTQVEGLSDLLEAETEAQRKQAMRVFSGAIGQKVDQWRDDLIFAAASLEVTIDFADEDVPVDVTPEVSKILNRVLLQLEIERDGYSAAERIQTGFEVAIVGSPNAGKSTLLNALVGREAAITSNIAGTTRDIIEVRMNLSGLPVTFLDTAGLRDSHDEVEKLGIDRAIERAEAADLRLFLTDLDGLPKGITPDENDLIYSGKADITGDEAGLSGKTGQGIDDLLLAITKTLQERTASSSVIIRERHKVAIESAISHIISAQGELLFGQDRMELAAEELRIAIGALESLIGRVNVENLLDDIFSRFCLGK